jgi:hypothetical protein
MIIPASLPDRHHVIVAQDSGLSSRRHPVVRGSGRSRLRRARPPALALVLWLHSVEFGPRGALECERAKRLGRRDVQ